MDKRKRGFLKLLQRYQQNTSGAEERQAMDVWYDGIDNENITEPESTARKEIENRIWANIQLQKDRNIPVNDTAQNRFNPSFFKFAAAAAVLLVLGFFYYFSDYRSISDFPVRGITAEVLARLSEKKNKTRTSQVILLSDGSRVTLEPGSTLFYPESFDSQSRTVYLVGDGFFDIAKNPEKPFLVFSDKIVTRVLGTRFSIRKDGKSGDVEVAVMSGKVIVENSPDANAEFEKDTPGVLLTPNKKVTYLHSTEQYVTGLVEKPVFVEQAAEPGQPDAFNFQEVPLKTIVEKLQRAYGVDIKIANEAIRNCSITADLSGVSLFAQLEVINALLNTRSEVQQTTITLQGGECIAF